MVPQRQNVCAIRVVASTVCRFESVEQTQSACNDSNIAGTHNIIIILCIIATNGSPNRSACKTRESDERDTKHTKRTEKKWPNRIYYIFIIAVRAACACDVS